MNDNVYDYKGRGKVALNSFQKLFSNIFMSVKPRATP